MGIAILSIFFGIPAIFFIFLLFLLITKPSGIGWAFFFAAYAALNIHEVVSHSRSSTAGVAYMFLPGYCMILAILGLCFGKFRKSNRKVYRVLAYASLALILCYVGASIYDETVRITAG